MICAVTFADDGTPGARAFNARCQQFWRTAGLYLRTVRWMAVASSPAPLGAPLPPAFAPAAGLAGAAAFGHSAEQMKREG